MKEPPARAFTKEVGTDFHQAVEEYILFTLIPHSGDRPLSVAIIPNKLE
jgi:hypothetical protein